MDAAIVAKQKRIALGKVGDRGKDARYEFDLPRSTTAGSIRITFAGFQTGAIAYPPTRTSMTTALESLTSISAGNVDVKTTFPFLVRLKNELGSQPLPLTTHPFSVDGSSLVPAAVIQVEQLDVGEAPLMLDKADEIYEDNPYLENVENTTLLECYIRKHLLQYLLGQAHKSVDIEIAGRDHKLNQQFQALWKLYQDCLKEIEGILNPTGNIDPSTLANSDNMGIATGRITKRTPNELDYGKVAYSELTGDYY